MSDMNHRDPAVLGAGWGYSLSLARGDTAEDLKSHYTKRRVACKCRRVIRSTNTLYSSIHAIPQSAEDADERDETVREKKNV